MALDLDTLLAVVDCTIDEVYQQHVAAVKPTRPGSVPERRASEVLPLAVLA